MGHGYIRLHKERLHDQHINSYVCKKRQGGTSLRILHFHWDPECPREAAVNKSWEETGQAVKNMIKTKMDFSKLLSKSLGSWVQGTPYLFFNPAWLASKDWHLSPWLALLSFSSLVEIPVFPSLNGSGACDISCLVSHWQLTTCRSNNPVITSERRISTGSV